MAAWTRHWHEVLKSSRTLFDWNKSPGAEREPRKIVVAGSLTAAVRSCLVHLIPILTSTAILAVNIHGIYIGIDFPGAVKSDTMTLLLLQVAAKAQELLIVASLSQIIFQFIRYELLFGDGLPLGLLGSGLTFNSFGFFFTKEFYGALSYLSFRGDVSRKLAFLAILVVCGLTSLLAGPSSAVLLVPKAQTYPAGGTEFYLTGTSNDFWPEDLSDVSELRRFCTPLNSTDLGICPAGGFFSLQEQWAAFNYTNFLEQNVPQYAKDLSNSRFYWPVRSRASQIPPLYALGDPRADRPDVTTAEPYTWLVQAHAATAVTLQRITTDWWNVISSHFGVDPLLIDDRNIHATVRSSISSVRCASPQNISVLDNTIQFPTIQGRWGWSPSAAFKDDTINSTASGQVRFHWVHLPDEFGAVSIGAVFESPWTSNQNSRLVIGCSAQTGWVPTQLFTDSYTFWSGWYPWGIDFGDRTPAWTDTTDDNHLLSTNGRIALGDDWLNLLTPLTSALNSDGRALSTIESILQDVGLADTATSDPTSTLTEDWLGTDALSNAGKTRFLEAIICSILSDGLSRSGSHRIFNTTGPASMWSLAMYDPRPDFGKRILRGQSAFYPPSPSTDVTVLQASMQISGFAFRITFAGYLSMSVLLAHICMALTHSAWLLSKKRTFRSWSTISELLALSQNSRPPQHALINTGAGIQSSKTFASVAKVRVRQKGGDTGLEHVELVFDDDTSTQLTVSKPKASPDEGWTSSTSSTTSKAEPKRRGRGGSWTFPLDQNKLYIQLDVEREPSPDFRQKLLAEEENTNDGAHDLVNVDIRYS